MILFREEDIFTALEPDDKGTKVGRIRTGFGTAFFFSFEDFSLFFDMLRHTCSILAS